MKGLNLLLKHFENFYMVKDYFDALCVSDSRVSSM